ncbi:hypothetical protein BDV95DRAFT_566447 [Massariosphaeria phaeospora]|uniref:Uncharacterized protein n=1 Tax=Massariosphaeria phaeospora TaxID=100035 RepID=A0A7C8IJT4_9PLEO|nr:hypothetical protein BDV95DRAFT_566447 [Massariosphaeria phaeospora]
MSGDAGPPHASLTDTSDRYEPAWGPRRAPEAETASLTTGPADAGRLLPQDPFAYYKAFVQTRDPTSDTPTASSLVHGDGDNAPPFGAQPFDRPGDQQQPRVRPVAYNHAVRLANRSNGAPLATIVEQGSYSTLNSHGSLLGVGRYPSIRAVENVPPDRARAALAGLHQCDLRGIPENTHTRRGTCEETRLHAGLDKDLLHPRLAWDTIPVKLAAQECATPELRHLNEDPDGKGLKGFFRGVLHNVRGPSRTRSRSCSTPTIVPTEDPDNANSHIHPEHEGPIGDWSKSNHGSRVSGSATDESVSSSSPGQDSSSTHSRHRRDSGSSARNRPRLEQKMLAATHTEPGLVQIPFLLPLIHSSSSTTEQPYRVPGEPAEYHNSHGRYALFPGSRDDLSGRYALSGGPFHRANSSSPREYDHAQDPSRNASFCSTSSTTYSGPVLGVDVDLQHDLGDLAVRTSTPRCSNLCSTPHQALHYEDEVSGSSGEREQHIARMSPHSITSSALPILLPLAAASGIVQPNYATPRLSFFSPSGSLIQAEDSSSPSIDSSKTDCTIPTTKTLYPRNTEASPAQKTLLASAKLPPVRPALVPLTTPPTTIAPLPRHLKHHHNYQHPEETVIVPQSQSTIVEGTAIRGCDGMVRNRSIQPRTRLRDSPLKPRQRRSEYDRSLTSPSNNDRSTIIAISSQPRSRNTLQKLQPPRSSKQRPERRPRSSSAPSAIGPITGHALRVCFCQPDLVTGHTATGRGFNKLGDQPLDQACGNSSAREATPGKMPNVRIVTAERKGKRSQSTVGVGLRVSV